MKRLLVRALLGLLIVEGVVAGLLVFDHLGDDEAQSALPGPVLTEAQSLALPPQSADADASLVADDEPLTQNDEPSGVLANLVNAYRIANGLLPLYVEPVLSAAASQYCGSIAPLQHQSHIGLDGEDQQARAADAGYAGAGVVENLAWGFVTPEEVVAAWEGAATESANLLDPEIDGIGVAHCTVESGDYLDWWVYMAGVGADE